MQASYNMNLHDRIQSALNPYSLQNITAYYFFIYMYNTYYIIHIYFIIYYN